MKLKLSFVRGWSYVGWRGGDPPSLLSLHTERSNSQSDGMREVGKRGDVKSGHAKRGWEKEKQQGGDRKKRVGIRSDEMWKMEM